METKDTDFISYIAHEGEMARMERVNNRLWVVIIILVVALLATNGAWIWYESQWEDVVVTQENADGYNSYIGNDGEIINGYGEANNKNEAQENRR